MNVATDMRSIKGFHWSGGDCDRTGCGSFQSELDVDLDLNSDFDIEIEPSVEAWNGHPMEPGPASGVSHALGRKAHLGNPSGPIVGWDSVTMMSSVLRLASPVVSLVATNTLSVIVEVSPGIAPVFRVATDAAVPTAIEISRVVRSISPAPESGITGSVV